MFKISKNREVCLEWWAGNQFCITVLQWIDSENYTRLSSSCNITVDNFWHDASQVKAFKALNKKKRTRFPSYR